MEEMLVTQALDERDLLKKKISNKIAGAYFVSMMCHNEEKVTEGQISQKEFEEKAKSQYQQIQDLITRYQKIDAAIINSNANTYIEVTGKKYSIAAAIALRSRLKGGFEDTDFELKLALRMQETFNEVIQKIDSKNQKLQLSADGMRNSIVGNDSQTKDESALIVVDTYVKENSWKLIDPLDLRSKVESLKEERDAMLRELDTKIKVSNATTMIAL